MSSANRATVGRVYLVGAGPGDPGLITVRGVECLRMADLVLYDYLANPALLRHAPETAERVCLGRHGHGRLLTQDEVNARMIEAAKSGRTVVRLKGGDPAIFARAGEEIAALNAAGIPYEMTPGVTVALAAGSYAGVALTHRDQASAVAIVTGQERDAKPEEALDYAALAKFPGTLVFYMGVTNARRWTAALVEGGKPPTTPAAIVRRCSWPDQQTVRCTLATIADTLEAERLRPPLIVIVGDVAARQDITSWFTARPLFGQKVLVTRPLHQADALCNALRELGAEPLVQPAIRIEPPADWQGVDAAMEHLPTYDWIVFSSANGVDAWMKRLHELNFDARQFGRTKIAAIGSGTADALATYHLRADLVPEEFRAEALAEALAGEAKGKRFLLIRASRGREVLAETLRRAGGQVEQVVVYRSTDVTTPDAEVAAALDAQQIDWVTVTSSAIARSLVAMFGEALRSTQLASISPITSASLRELGFEPAAEATEYTMAGVAEAIRLATEKST